MIIAAALALGIVIFLLGVKVGRDWCVSWYELKNVQYPTNATMHNDDGINGASAPDHTLASETGRAEEA